MAEPQPADIHEGADIDDEHPTKPASAEDRKAAAALSSLDRGGDDDEKAANKSEADQKALGDAMNRLEVMEKGKGGDVETKTTDTEIAKKKVKVDQVDVTLLVEELELSKIKAMELLKAHDGNAVDAVRAFVTSSA